MPPPGNSCSSARRLTKSMAGSGDAALAHLKEDKIILSSEDERGLTGIFWTKRKETTGWMHDDLGWVSALWIFAVPAADIRAMSVGGLCCIDCAIKDLLLQR
jgi:hypothetical protein